MFKLTFAQPQKFQSLKFSSCTVCCRYICKQCSQACLYCSCVYRNTNIATTYTLIIIKVCPTFEASMIISYNTSLPTLLQIFTD